MRERVIIAFIAVVLGLLITSAGFFLYESTRIVPQEKKEEQKVKAPKPAPESLLFLTIDEPKDEALVTKRTIQVKGKTNKDSTIVISSNQEDVVVTPAENGQFSATLTIDAGTNKLITQAISPKGEEKIDERIVTFSTEEF